MKRLAVISTNDSPYIGGSETLWLRTAAQLRSEGVEVAVSLSQRARNSVSLKDLQESADSITIRNPDIGAKLVGRVLHRFRHEELVAWLKNLQPDLALISLGDYLQGWQAASSCRAAGVPYALLVQAASEFFGPEPDRFWEHRSAYEQAVANYFVSEANLRHTSRSLALAIPRARVVRNPFQVSYDASPPWPDGPDWHIACPARLDAFAKGHDLLLELFAHPVWRSRNVWLHLYGDGPHRASLERIRDRQRLERVVFEGHTADIEAVWRRNHLLVLPSRQEGLPLALVEALLCGRPAVVTDVAGNTEVVEDETTGFIVRAPTLPFLAEAMERAWNRREQWQAMGREAARHIREKIPPDPAAEFAQLLRQIAPPTPRSIRVESAPPKVSLCLPNLDKRPFLAERMTTLLSQTFTHWEMIVCDSHSKDGSWEFLRKFSGDPRIRLHRVPREGIYAGWNECLRRVRGEYVYLATSDDTSHPRQIERLVAALDARPSAAIALGQFDYIDERGIVLPRRRHRLRELLGAWAGRPHVRQGVTEFLLHCAFDTAWVTLNALLFRQSLLERTGLFPTHASRYGDLSWSLRAALVSGEIVYVPDALAGWRQYRGQATVHRWDAASRRLLLRELDAVLDDPASGIPAAWTRIPGWKEKIRRYRLAAWHESLGLTRSNLRTAPGNFLAGFVTALFHDRAYLAQVLRRGLSPGEETRFEGPTIARELIRDFDAPWPPQPL